MVDLNSDMGESYGRWRLGDDDSLLTVVTSANVACGFHAGDPPTLRSTCAAAVRAGVVIGAQVSYHDLAGFGRRFMDVPGGELTDELIYQIGALDGLARVSGDRVRYVKPHGALYNAAVHHREHAAAVVKAVLEYDGSLPVLVLPGSILQQLAERAGLRTVREGFADRGYREDGTLIPRTDPGAVLSDDEQIARQVDRLVETVDSICLHSDTPGAAHIARLVRDRLDGKGHAVAAFASRG